MMMTDVKIALKSLRATRVRTALTMLGIVIGVAAVTAVLALGEGAKQKIAEQTQALGPNLLTVRPGKATRDSQGNVLDYNLLAALGSSTLSERDVKTVEGQEGIEATAPIIAITGSVSTPDKKQVTGTSIIATTPDCLEVMGLEIRAGEFLNDVTSRETVVLGSDLALELLGSDTAIGQKITLRGQEFTVLGILNRYKAKPSLSNFFDFNRTAFIPVNAGKGFNQGMAQIQQINAQVEEGRDARQIAADLQANLLDNHGGEEDFTVLRPEESIAITDNLLQMVTLLTSAVASVSLVVGGVGIMNIMLVSVTERTREIGIRKAVGATNAQILRQFLIEALMMSVVGSIVGVAVGYALAFGIGIMVEFPPVLTWQVAGSALGIAVLIGVIFGLAPAIKASRKDPIEALRHFS